MSSIAPFDAEIIAREQESPSIFTLSLRLVDSAVARNYRFHAGQFNMLYLYGVGEIPISIVSDPLRPEILKHTIRSVGRVTGGFSKLQPGGHIGLRGPFGRGWPLEAAEGKDVLMITGGLGCAPAVSVVNYIHQRRGRFGRLIIIQGVKHSDDLIWRDRYQVWSNSLDTEVLLAADQSSGNWPWYIGPVTGLIGQVDIDPAQTIVMMCGPEAMMIAATASLQSRGIGDDAIWLSMERNMQCAVRRCGHCQYGARFVCQDGPVFPYPEVRDLFARSGF